MASGLPLLVTKVEGLIEVVGEGGFYFESGDIDELANKILYIFANPDLANEKIKKALERVRLFSLNSTVDNYNDLYLKCYQVNVKS